MLKKRFAGFFFIILFFVVLSKIQAKEVLCEANSRLKQVKFNIRSGEIFFIDKYQNINGNITEFWRINDVDVLKDVYYQKMLMAEKEEEEIKREEEERIKQAEEQARRERLTQKKKEEEEFLIETRLQALKRLVNLELEKVEKSFKNLDQYQLEQYFVFADDTFSTQQSLDDVKINLINQARELTIRSTSELTEEELKESLAKLENTPDKIEVFFRQSVKFAINQCNDTKRLKELLALI